MDNLDWPTAKDELSACVQYLKSNSKKVCKDFMQHRKHTAITQSCGAWTGACCVELFEPSFEILSAPLRLCLKKPARCTAKHSECCIHKA